MSDGSDAGVNVPAAKSRHRLALLAALYVSQAIPLGFFVEAVPAIGRDFGLERRDIGLIQALALPFLLKFLWAPLVDRWGSQRHGHYRSWLVPLQALAVVSVAGIALLDPAAQFGWLLPLAALFLLCAATQDVASDGLAVRLLARSERGIGNGVQVGGYYLGQILGGGLTLLLYALWGWRPAVLCLALLMALPMLPLARFREPPRPREEAGEPSGVDWAALGRFFRRSGNGGWIAVLVLFRAAEAMALTMAKPLFVDLGLGLARIGLIVGLGNSIGALLGAIAGGIAVERLGRRRAMAGFSAFQAFALAAFLLPAGGVASVPLLWIISLIASLAGGMATAALYTSMMDRSRTESAATDFTLQQSLAAVGPLVGSALSGFSAESLGYSGHFVLCAVLAAVVAILVGRFRLGFR